MSAHPRIVHDGLGLGATQPTDPSAPRYHILRWGPGNWHVCLAGQIIAQTQTHAEALDVLDTITRHHHARRAA